MNSFRLFVVRKILDFVPETRAFGMKRILYRWAGAIISEAVRINSSVKITGVGKLSIGANTWIGPNTIILCSSEISIGANCDIAPKVYIGDGTHEITPKEDRIAGVDTTRKITIGDGCWLCVNSTVLPGVTIGNKCVVAAGAVVTKNVDDMTLVAGVPARRIKDL